MDNNSKGVIMLLGLNGICLAGTVGLSLLVDGNGDIWGLSHAISLWIVVPWFALAVLAGIALSVLGGRMRVMGVIGVCLYLIWLVPLLL